MKKKAKAVAPPIAADEETPAWTFLTNHTHVLWCIYQEPEIRLRDVAERVGITERMVQKVVAELAAAKYLTVEKNGRRNLYKLQVEKRLRHPLEGHCTVGQVLDLLQRSKNTGASRATRPSSRANE